MASPEAYEMALQAARADLAWADEIVDHIMGAFRLGLTDELPREVLVATLTDPLVGKEPAALIVLLGVALERLGRLETQR